MKTRQGHDREVNYRTIFLSSTDAKVFNNILANQIQQYNKMTRYHDQVGFFRDTRMVPSSQTNQYDTLQQQQKIKDKIYRIIIVHAEKSISIYDKNF